MKTLQEKLKASRKAQAELKEKKEEQLRALYPAFYKESKEEGKK